MNVFETCGKLAAGVSVLVVLLAIGLVVLVIACMALGAYESVTNPQSSSQTAQEYQQLQQNISSDADQIHHAVPAGAGP